MKKKAFKAESKRLLDLMADPDPVRAKRAMDAMMTMRRIDIAALEAAVA